MFAVHLLEADEEAPRGPEITETGSAAVLFAGSAIEITIGHFGGGFPVIQLSDPEGNRLVFTSSGRKPASR